MKWKPIARTSLPLFGAVVVFSLLLGWLYGRDNKYTHPGSQAISGLLVLDAPTLEQEQVFYLTQGSFSPLEIFITAKPPKPICKPSPSAKRAALD